MASSPRGAISSAASAAAPSSDPTAFADTFNAICDNVEVVVRGKRPAVELALLAVVAEGHLLIEDVPGVGKTLLAKALAASIDGSWRRVQFTPDLLPSDVIGVSVFDRPSGRFEFRPGALFANFVLCDEINRASPKTQSALLEAMEERQVTVDGRTHPLPQPFVVLATQNPLEHEGTYPLPESQLDRFLVWTSMGYPDRAAELAVLDTHGDDDALARLAPVASLHDVADMIHTARRTHAAQALKGYIVDLAHASRRHPQLRLGMSPRASLSVLRIARARAAAAGRAFVLPDDVQAVLEPVLGHRLLLTPEALSRGVRAEDVVAELVASVPVPSPRRA